MSGEVYERSPLLGTGSVNADDAAQPPVNRWDLCNPRTALHRYMVLVFMCFLSFGSYFCYDSPGSLQGHILSDMDVGTSQYANLYAWYSWPNVILCFFGGFLIDRVFGIRLGAIIFATFIMAGQVVVATGALIGTFWVMEAGRFIFGIGGESLAVAQNTYAVAWFKGKELNMVFGLQLSCARLGSTVNFLVMDHIYEFINHYFTGHKCLGVVLMIATVTCVFSLICALILAYFDKRAEKILDRAAGSTGEVIRIQDVKDFPPSFWLLTVICVTYYVAIFPFIGLGQMFFHRKYDMSLSDANQVNSIVYIVSAGASPLLGIAVDRTGFNLLWVFLAILVSLGCHMMLAFTYLNPWVPMVTMGLAYSLLACGLWPMVAVVVPQHQLGTAYGIMQSVQNLGLALIVMASGSIVDNNGYFILEVFFLAWLCAALLSVIALFLVDMRKGGVLNMSVKERKKREEAKLVTENLEKERLMHSGSMADISPHDLLQPRSEFHIRNRYFSKIDGKFFQLPPNYDISTCALLHRTGLT